jgi:hypothetical protein
MNVKPNPTEEAVQMGEENPKVTFSAEDANKTVEKLTDTLAALKGKAPVLPDGKPWFFPEGINLHEYHA